MYTLAGQVYFSGDETGDQLKSLIKYAMMYGMFDDAMSKIENPEHIGDIDLDPILEYVQERGNAPAIAHYVNLNITDRLARPFEKHWLSFFEELKFDASIIHICNITETSSEYMSQMLQVANNFPNSNVIKFVGASLNSRYLTFSRYSNLITSDGKQQLQIREFAINNFLNLFYGSFMKNDILYIHYAPSGDMRNYYKLNRMIHVLL